MKPKSTHVRDEKLCRVFPKNNQAAARMARLAVLFEDLRIEILGMTLPKDFIQPEACSPQYRELYFMRRSIATIHEFAEALDHVELTEEFRSWPLDPVDLKVWEEARTTISKHREFFKGIRNDMGGHFGQQAALKAINHLSDDSEGRIEISIHGEGGGAKLEFAGDIAATCLHFHCEGTSTDAKIRDLFLRLQDCFEHAVKATNIVTGYYFWPRFEHGTLATLPGISHPPRRRDKR